MLDYLLGHAPPSLLSDVLCGSHLSVSFPPRQASTPTSTSTLETATTAGSSNGTGAQS